MSLSIGLAVVLGIVLLMAAKRGWAESLIVVGVSLKVRSFGRQSWSQTLSTFTSKTELGGRLGPAVRICHLLAPGGQRSCIVPHMVLPVEARGTLGMR